MLLPLYVMCLPLPSSVNCVCVGHMMFVTQSLVLRVSLIIGQGRD